MIVSMVFNHEGWSSMQDIIQPKIDNPVTLLEFFSAVADPRIERSKQYPLINVLVFTFVSILSDQTSWYQIEEFCETNIDWFAEFLDISSGVPSHDTFRRVLSLIDTGQLENAIIQWLENTRTLFGSSRRVVALDGKSLRGVAWKINEEQLHILNAWDASNNKFVGQLTVEKKTNEITAAPKMLSLMDLKETVITVDAIMTQREVAKTIISKGGNYVMALKGNQGTLFDDVKLYFSESEHGMSCSRSVEKNRGQVEIRTCTKTDNITWLTQKSEWQGLNGLFRIDSEIIKEGKISRESRYYITSLCVDASELLWIARQHWAVENQLHRTLDVHFKEDGCQVHNRRAAANLSVLRKLALSLLKQIDPKKTLISKLKKSAYSPGFRRKCLLGIF